MRRGGRRDCTGRVIVSSALLLAAFAGISPSSAQLPVARILQVYPPGGRAGTTFEVTVNGSDLDDPAGLHFSHSGITAMPKNDRFTVTIASNTPPGIYEMRFVGRFGLSNPRAFAVGLLPETLVPSTNTSVASAISLGLDTTSYGRAQANATAWFRIKIKKAQRVLMECETESIDSRMDPVLAIADSTGRELERARTTGLIDFSAPAEAEYLLAAHDFLYRGGDAYIYRLTVSSGPHIDYIFPPCGLPGTKTNYLVYGRNLPGGKPVKGQTVDGQPLEQLSVEITFPSEERARRLNTGLLLRPGDATLDGFEYRLKTPRGPSNPFLLTMATGAVVPEQEPNDQPEHAQKLTLPCDVAGRFQPAGDSDWFTFQAKKGEVYWVEVFSARLGFATDPFVLVQRVSQADSGKVETSDVLELSDNDVNLGDREFNTTSRDPVGRFEAKEEGTYRLLVRDLFRRAESAGRSLYRLSLRRETPDFRLVAMTVLPRPKGDAKNIELGVPFLRRGETIPVRVLAFRRDGFNGEIDLSLDPVPPGLIFQGDRIPAGQGSDTILITAADDAPTFAGPIKLIGKAKLGDRELVREARGGTMVFPVGNYDNERAKSRLTRELTLGVSDREAAPISIAPAEKKTWEAAADAKLKVPLNITRRGDFNANFKLKPLGPGNQDALKEFEVDGKATNTTLNLDFAALKLSPGTYIFAAQTQTAGKYRNNPEAAAFAEAAAKEADKVAADLEAAAKQAAADLDAAEKKAKETEGAAKTAADNLAAAKAALEKAATDEKLGSERDAAEKAATEAAAKAKAALEARSAATKAKADADARAKEAKSRKETAAARAKETAERAKPREATVQVHSVPIFVKVTPVQQAKSK
jgi:hypothetical protein